MTAEDDRRPTGDAPAGALAPYGTGGVGLERQAVPGNPSIPPALS